MPTGSSVHYVSGPGGDRDHLPLPRDTGGYRQPHVQHEPRPTGIDFDALAPTCKVCGQKSGTVNFRTGMCASCDPVVATKKPPKKEKQQRKPATRRTPPRAPQPAPAPTPEPVVELEHPQPHAGEHQADPETRPLATPPGLSPDPGRRLVLELDDVRTTLVRAHGHPDATITQLRDLALQAVGILRTRLDELHPHEQRRPHLVTGHSGQPETSSQPEAQPPDSLPDAEPPRVARSPRPRRSRATPSWATPVDEQAIVREYVEDLDTPPVIGSRHGILPKRVRSILERHDIELRDDRRGHSGSQAKLLDQYDDDQVRSIVDRYNAGESSTTIGTSIGASQKLVATILKKAGVELRPPASIARATVIDEATAAEIARRYAAGDSSNDLATEYRIRAERCRQIVVDHGIAIRSKGDGSRHLQQLIRDMGVTAKDVKIWAVEQGLLEKVTRGSVAAKISAAYAAAHQPADTTLETQEAIA